MTCPCLCKDCANKGALVSFVREVKGQVSVVFDLRVRDKKCCTGQLANVTAQVDVRAFRANITHSVLSECIHTYYTLLQGQIKYVISLQLPFHVLS